MKTLDCVFYIADQSNRRARVFHFLINNTERRKTTANRTMFFTHLEEVNFPFPSFFGNWILQKGKKITGLFARNAGEKRGEGREQERQEKEGESYKIIDPSTHLTRTASMLAAATTTRVKTKKWKGKWLCRELKNKQQCIVPFGKENY